MKKAIISALLAGGLLFSCTDNKAREKQLEREKSEMAAKVAKEKERALAAEKKLADIAAKKAAEEKARLAAASRNNFAAKLQPYLVNADGSKAADITSSEYVLLYFSASWCPPCRKFTPVLVDKYKEIKNKKFATVLVSADRSDDAMYKYMKGKKMPFPAISAKNRAKVDLKQFSQRGIPCLALIDSKGNAVVKGYVNKLGEIVEIIK